MGSFPSWGKKAIGGRGGGGGGVWLWGGGWRNKDQVWRHGMAKGFEREFILNDVSRDSGMKSLIVLGC